MDAKRLDEIKARAEAATPGPWKLDWDTDSTNVGGRQPEQYKGWACGPDVAKQSFLEMRVQIRHDVIFIQNARTDIPDLLAALEAAQAEVARLRAALEDARTVIEAGIGLMTVDQLGEWSGVRSWLEQAPEGYMGVCRWKALDDDWNAWEGECGAAWVFDNGGPTENEMHFCPKCGKRAALKGEAIFDEMDQVTHCAACGNVLQPVRPGKWQCPKCG